MLVWVDGYFVGTNVIEEDHTTGKRLMVFVAGPILFSLGLSFFNYTLVRDATAHSETEQFREAYGRRGRIEAKISGSRT